MRPMQMRASIVHIGGRIAETSSISNPRFCTRWGLICVTRSRMSDSNSVTFLASLPDIGSAFRVSGHKNGARITLEIPESEMHAALALLVWREQVLRITVEPAGHITGENLDNNGRTRR